VSSEATEKSCGLKMFVTRKTACRPEAISRYLASCSRLVLLTYLLTPWSRVLLEKLTGFAASQEQDRTPVPSECGWAPEPVWAISRKFLTHS
jgi:hypothetical protein